MALGVGGWGGNLADPVLKIVVIGDTRDKTCGVELKKGADSQEIRLIIGRRKISV